jgi:hypothetical protein
VRTPTVSELHPRTAENPVFIVRKVWQVLDLGHGDGDEAPFGGKKKKI